MESSNREQLSEVELADLLNAWVVECPSDRLRAAVFPAAAPGGLRSGVWLAAAACLLAACVAGVVWNHATKVRTPAADGNEAEPFTPIPYTVPLRSGENARVVRTKVSAAELMTDGFRLPAGDGAQESPADVLLGEDGRPIAIRLVTAKSARN
jgi:hypothetical protein